ncbi:MAG TPA: hypothetical protein VK468_00365 [Pyrinomonadaceae bacterium]|nr:hypothetical protein [Pyrinomonadaceae bacterium]
MIFDVLNGNDKKVRVQKIAERLLAQDSVEEQFATDTQEEYDLLFEAIKEGWLPEHFNLGRSGMWLNKKRIQPPKAHAFH